ncbi:hypothetical protein SAMN06295964_3102 [Aeromicrobium choanae]|uniref:DUF6881 domain-containing protein n=2 Tax=Aeromicrobium choanae TaxID=1736691 RepID=A0A1T4Z805_9ACTN|nr:hypothetical protein SAMN06295964_3102 [Aeromicrobium choanae]
MRHLQVRWSHGSTDHQVMLYSEIDNDGYEIRKVDEYANGRLDLAGEGIETGSTGLGTERIPPMEEINVDPQSRAAPLDPVEFEQIWDRAKAWFDLP